MHPAACIVYHASPRIHEAQLLSYMKSTGLKVGLLINFNVKQLKSGIKRMVT